MPEINTNSTPQINNPISPPGHPHKWLVGILIALLVVAVAVTAVFLISKKIAKSEPNENEAVICMTDAKICPDGSSVGREGPNCEFAECPMDETEGWQTYHNEEFGFEVKYPPSFSADFSNTNVLQIAENPGDREFPGIWVYIYENDENLSAEEWWKQTNEYDPENEEYENITIGGKQTLKITNFIAFAGEVDFIISTNDTIFRILRLGLSDDTVNQILSTFRFLDSVDTSNWQTYRNEEFGFVFKYPEGWEIPAIGNTEVSGDIFGLSFASPETQESPKYPSYGGEFVLTVWKNPENKSFDEFGVFNYIEEAATGNIEDRQIDDILVKVFRSVVGNTTGDIAVIQGDKIFIQFRYDGDDLELFDQILSTFRFLP